MSDPRADQLRAGYVTVARAYREQLGNELAGKPLDRAMLDAFVESVTGLIVDVGCGPGHVTRYLASRGASVEGVDLSPAMIAEATASQPGLAFRQAERRQSRAVVPREWVERLATVWNSVRRT